MCDEYEFISRKGVAYHVLMVNMLYRTPHFHLDYEILTVLEGQVEVTTRSESFKAQAGDVCLFNPLERHEFSAVSPCLILSLQVPMSFLTPVCPKITNVTFDVTHLKKSEPAGQDCRKRLIEIAWLHLQKEPWQTLQCGALIQELFFSMLKELPYHLRPQEHAQAYRRQGVRMRNILDYIETHCNEEITLQDLAEREGLSPCYMSHYFTETFGMSLTEYLTRLRCEKARRRLLLTDETLLDVSIACGFSDPKYLRKGFQKIFGCTPKEYRERFGSEDLPLQQTSLLTAQEFLSDEAGFVMLDRIVQNEKSQNCPFCTSSLS